MPPHELDEYRAMSRRLGIARTVFSTPSVYGTDNRSLVDTLAKAGGHARRLLSLPNVVLTPHVAGSTVETSARVGLTAVDHLLAVLEDRPVDPRAIVNPEVLDPPEQGRGEVVQQPGRPS